MIPILQNSELAAISNPEVSARMAQAPILVVDDEPGMRNFVNKNAASPLHAGHGSRQCRRGHAATPARSELTTGSVWEHGSTFTIWLPAAD